MERESCVYNSMRITMATFAYGRVSTTDQTSINQRLEIEHGGIHIDYWYADEGVSGKTQASQRPQFKALLHQIRDGETLVVTKLDRLGRDAQDVNATIKTLAKRKIEVIVLQLGKLDLTSTAGKLMLNMLATLAEYERELIVERVNAGIAAARANGTRFGRPLSDPVVIADKLAIAADARARGRTAEDAARLDGWSRATLYRHQQAHAARESAAM